ncbi:MAG TPA: preprotein translocase subunit SecG [Kofleriaceae bacterium]|jgi:preprotein translocase subunit SecG
MTTLLTVLHILVCIFLMLTVLLQSGKSGGMGAAFGGGNAATVFGGSGASTFLRKLTAGAVTVFMLDSMTLAFLASRNSGDALEKFGEQEQQRAKQKADARAAAHGGSAGSAAVAPFVVPAGAGSGMIMLGSGAADNDEGVPPATTGSAVVPAHAQPATTPTEQVAPPADQTKPADSKPSDKNLDKKPADTKPAGTTPAAHPNVPTPPAQ